MPVRRRARLLQGVAVLLAFAGGFVLVCAALTRLVAPVAAGASERADRLRERGAAFALFLVPVAYRAFIYFQF